MRNDLFLFAVLFVFGCTAPAIVPEIKSISKTIYYFPQIHRADTMDKSDVDSIKELQYQLYQCLEDFNRKTNQKTFFMIEGWRNKFRGQGPTESLREYLYDETAGLALLFDKKINGSPEGKTIEKEFYFRKAQEIVNHFETELSKMTRLDPHDYQKFVISNGCADHSFKCSADLAHEAEFLDSLRLNLLQQKINLRKEETIAIVFGSYHAPDIAKKFQSKFYTESEVCNKYYQAVNENINH